MLREHNQDGQHRPANREFLEFDSPRHYLYGRTQPLFFTEHLVRRDISMPEVGDTAPDFELPSHLIKDKKVKLSEFRGNNNVVLAFYPLAWTPV